MTKVFEHLFCHPHIAKADHEVQLFSSFAIESLGLDLFDVLEVLENGLDCASGGNRKQGVEECCLLVGGKVLRVVIAEGFFGIEGTGGKEEVYYLIPVSIESPKKGRF